MKPKSKLVCYCIGVTEQTIVESIERGNVSLSAIKSDTKACTGDRCKELNPSGKCCSKDIKQLIEEYSVGGDGLEFSCCC